MKGAGLLGVPRAHVILFVPSLAFAAEGCLLKRARGGREGPARAFTRAFPFASSLNVAQGP